MEKGCGGEKDKWRRAVVDRNVNGGMLK